MLAAFRSNKLEHTISLYGKDGERADLLYQHTYNRRSGIRHSVTTEQRPDFVLNIYRENNMVLTYLYDAKYRLVDDRDEVESADEGIDFDVVDYPVNEAINQMHRYRDAIYYGLSDDQRPRNKEVIGGYFINDFNDHCDFFSRPTSVSRSSIFFFVKISVTLSPNRLN